MNPLPPPLEPDLDDLLDAERQAAAPPDALGRVWSRMVMPLGISHVQPAKAASAHASGLHSGLSGLHSVLASHGLSVVLAAVAGVGAGAALPSLLKPAPPAHVAHVDHPSVKPMPAVARPSPTVEAVPSTPDPEPVAAPTAVRTAPLRVSPSRRDSFSIRDERSVLDQARAALSRGDGAGALALTDDYTHRFARPQLGEECETIAIQGLVLAGRYAEARDRAARFEAASPNSLFRPAVEAALASIR